MPKYVILNGPPKSGKDTIGRLINFALASSGRQSIIDKFAEPLKAAASAIFCLTHAERLHYFENPVVKDHPSKRFLGKTPRQVLISLSEDWFKPTFGKDVFGRLMIQRTAHLEGFTVITDCGFDEELEPFDKTDIAVVRLHRSGCNYANDSRSYIRRDDIFVFDVDNNDIPEYVAEGVTDKLVKEGFLHVEY